MKRLSVCYLCFLMMCPFVCGLFGSCEKVSSLNNYKPFKHAYIYLSTDLEESKAYLPDENKITDINLLIFNGEILEKKLYLKEAELATITSGKALKIKLIGGCNYHFLACANLGYELPVNSRQEALEYRYHMAYPDEFGCGMVMSASEEIFLTDDCTLMLTLKRIMAKVSLRLDRTLLDERIRLHCRSIKVCHCPRSCNLFSPSQAQDTDDFFIKGFELDETQCSPLNIENESQRSQEVSLYILENRSTQQNEKTGCYLEACFDYESDSLYSAEGNYLRYRFYLEEEGAYSVTRGKHYPLCLYPVGNGLGEGGWRIDRSQLSYKDGYCWFNVLPGNYIECRLGETFTIRTECKPSHAVCTFGEESLYSSSIERGMIDYEISQDGRSIQITSLKKGSSLIDIEFGPPINDGCFVIIVCEP